jgi:amino acid adenylation domain-containing protein
MTYPNDTDHLDAVAVIGMAGRFADSPDLQHFWRNLRDGHEAIRAFSDDELRAAGVEPARLASPHLVKAGSVLAGLELFDAAFFGLSPREAELMDPQQRLLLEGAWQALESAGYDAQAHPGRIGVFMSGRISDYFLGNLSSNPDLMARMNPLQLLFGNDKDYLATFISYKLNLRGPSISVQTACSSSLVAVHLACESVLNGQCDMALAGGISINLPQKTGYLHLEGGVLSADGHCRAFDAAASGTVHGSGMGMVVLKRLGNAIADGDSILAVVRGSAINNDGGLKVGYSAPSENGQAGVIAEAMQVAGVPPESISYVEAHGTGTPIGDPIEIAALTRVFNAQTRKRRFCAIGSVKTNLGHLEPAAGIAGLIKTVLMLEHSTLVPSLHFERPNPDLADFENGPFFVNTRTTPWHGNGYPRRAGVSSFGIGGTNAHVVVEEAPPAAPSGPSRPWQLLLLSAASPAALDAATAGLARHLGQEAAPDLADAAYTLRIGRRAFPHRRLVVCRDRDDAVAALADPRRVLSGVAGADARPVAFLFPGQGAQYPGMAAGLYQGEPCFRAELDRCARLLAPRLGLDLAALLCPPAPPATPGPAATPGLAGAPAAAGSAAAACDLERTALAQPALFAVEYALARLLMSWGITPAAMIGHSIGEYVAACLAGVFTLEEALELVAARGSLMDGLPAGAMMAVSLPAPQLQPLLGTGLDLAAVNGPAMCSVAGPIDAVEALAAELARRGIEHRRLHTSHAFHSAMMEPVLGEFASRVRGVALKAPRIPYLSNLTGTWITAAEATDPAYWVRHLRETVRFAAGLTELLADPERVLLEVGPGRTLTTLARQSAGRSGSHLLLSSLRRPQDQDADAALLLTTLGRLWLAGVEPDWAGFHGSERRRRVALPTYPFERQRYWIEQRTARRGQPAQGAAALDVEVLPPAADQPEALAVYGRPALQVAYAAPRDAIERSVAAIWQELLGVETIGIHDSFFELGGHSLMMVQVVTRLREDFQVEMPMRSVAEAATVAELALQVAERRRLVAETGEAAAVPVLVTDPAGIEQPFALTEVQEAYWIGRTGLFDLGNVATHQYFEVEREGLDLDRLERAWRGLIDRHPMMRAIMLPDGRQQILTKVPAYEIAVMDLRGLPAEQAAERLEAVRLAMSHQVLPSDRWPLFDIRASRLDETRVRLHLSLDLLTADAWSVEILKQELSQFYADPDAAWPPLELNFRDYVLSEVAFRDSEPYRRSLAYWMERLPSLPDAPELPLARNPAELDRPRFVRRSGWLEAATWSRLKARAAREGLTPSGILVAVYSEVLARWSKSPRFLLNLTVFNRLPVHPQVNDVVGDFTSLSLLEVEHDGAAPFRARARRLQTRIWEDLDHRAVSGVRVMRERIRRRGGIAGTMAPVVFTSVLNLREAEGDVAPEATAAALLGQDTYSISQTPQVWLDHVATERYGHLLFTWDAVEELFPPALLQAMFDAYCALLQRLAAEEPAWDEVDLPLTPAAQLAVREAVNATREPGPEGLLHSLFAAQAVLRPDQPAVTGPGGELTYAELDRRANQVGRRLRELGARPNRLVAVVMDKGWEQVVAVLGVLRSGAAYLPVDPYLPAERFGYLLEHGEVELALTLGRLDEELAWPAGIRRLRVDGDDFTTAGAEELAAVQGPDDLAYVIFTSGTTGLPKGVMIDHRGAVNTIADVNRRFAVGPDDRVLALSALAFDLSVYDIFGVLAAGGTVVVPDAAAAREPGRWIELMTRHGVTLWNSVPALMKMLVDYAGGGPLAAPLRLVLLSGDWIPVSLPDAVRRLLPAARVVSLGGATEASIWSILYPIDEVDPAWPSIPYGRPMANQRFHVLDAALAPCPDWVPGQIHIAGTGLAAGYWRDAEKTAASFITHPRTGERLYRTGDLGRYLPDGTIEFLGREDSQVKVQGYRVELGEIEATLAQHPGIRTAVVAAMGERRGEKRLVAFVVPERGQPPALATPPTAAAPAATAVPAAAVDSAVPMPAREPAILIQDPIAQLEFKTRQLGLRRTEGRAAVALPARISVAATDAADAAEWSRPYLERRSHRHYGAAAVPVERVGELLRCLSSIEAGGKPKYRYPSAGSLYPVQAYLYVKPGRVAGVEGGAYYYHPAEHRLIALSGATLAARTFGSENAPIFERAAFAVFLIAEMQAIAPLYGNLARDFSLLEAGTMCQLLMTVAPALALGLCPVGTLFAEELGGLFALAPSHQFLLAMLGGEVDPAAGEAAADAGDYELFLRLLQQEAAGRPGGPPASPAAAATAATAAPPNLETLAGTEPAPREVRLLAGDDALTGELRDFLRAKLPDYMVPAGYVLLDALPLTANGKVDRQALARLDPARQPEAERIFVAPRDQVEERVAALWGEVLAIERPGVEDNFFEAGGHSLLAARLIGRLREAFQVELPLAALFDTPTVAGLAAAVRGSRPAERRLDAVLPAIVPDPERRHQPFPLTELQQAYWLGQSGAFELGNVSPQYYIELAFPDLDVERFGRALDRLIARHDMLRARALPDGSQQIVAALPPYEVEVLDLRGQDPEAQEDAVRALRQRFSEQGPAMDWPPLLRAAVCRLDEGRSRVLLSVSLMICDAWSFRILSRELGELYADLDAALPPLELSFRDYVLALGALESSAAFERSLEHWRGRLATLPPAPQLPLARDPATLRSRMARRTGSLEREAWARFKHRAAQAGVTPDSALGAAYAEVIAAWSRDRRFTLNVLYFNRLDLHPQVNAILANFSGTILLELDHRRPEPFAARARRFQDQLWQDIEHGLVTGVRVLRELARLQGAGARAAMPVVFASTVGLDHDEERPEGNVGDVVDSRLQTPQVWLDHQVYDVGGRLSFNWDVVEELFPAGLVGDMFAAYLELLDRLANGDDAAWQDTGARLLPAAQTAPRAAANATAAPLPEVRLEELFTARAAEHPERTAVIAAGRALTYGELDQLSNRIARRLRRLGARPNLPVAVVLERGWEQVAAVLGVLKSGAPYLPIAPDLPPERFLHLLERGEVEVAVTSRAVARDRRWPAAVRRVAVDDPALGKLSGRGAGRVGTPEDLAYLIFTSGSTGLPKGVMIDHRGAVNTILDVNRRFGIGAEDRVLALSALSFDLSVYDVFGTLAAGGAVVMPEPAANREPGRWREWMERERVTVWNSVPALMQMLVDHLEGRGEALPPSLRLVLMSGDWIPVTLPDRIRGLRDGVELVSLGGATEASIWSICQPIGEVEPSWTSIPYGRPMANQRFHVLNEALLPCPAWVPGQLHIAGQGLARGYWRDEATTAASFFLHPATGEPLYRTGDLGRYLPDGTIELLGREDFQVKVQGYRIELEEIEAALARHPSVRASVVTAVGEERGGKRLVAYVTLDAAPDAPAAVAEELRDFLQQRLPDYMVPHTFVVLESLPLTANGKVDRSALQTAAATRPGRQASFIPPRDEVELSLAAIWEEILDTSPVGVTDNFFDLGGHSLLAVRLMARIRRDLGRELPLAVLLEGATIERLAAAVRRQPGAEEPGTLVAIQRGDGRRPLFLVHPVGGSIACYGELARSLGADQGCYGLQAAGPAAGVAATVEEMAAAYLEALRAVQPHGPFQLGGWSMGGVVAFEMARQLARDGDDADLLVLVDVPAPAGDGGGLGDRGTGGGDRGDHSDLDDLDDLDEVDLLAWFARDLGGLVGLPLALAADDLRAAGADERLELLLVAARRSGSLPPDFSRDELRHHLDVFSANARALRRYRPRPYAGHVLLLLAQESGPDAPTTPAALAADNAPATRADAAAGARQAPAADASRGWAALASGVTIERIPGNHYTLVRRPQVAVLAERLRRRLAHPGA